MTSRKIVLAGILLVVLAVGALSSCGAGSDTIVVATDATWPPME